MIQVYSHATAWESALRCEERYFPDISEKLNRLRGGKDEVRIKQRWRADGKGGTKLGFGASVYPASIVLANFLVGKLEGKRIVEVGCGAGLASITAAKSGASYVVATDGDSQALDLSRENQEINHVTSEILKFELLLWGSRKDHERIRSMHGDFDVVIASDVAALVYGEDAMVQLIETFVALCAPRSATLFFSFKKRLNESVEKTFWDLFRERFDISMLPIEGDFKDDPTMGLCSCKLR